MCKMEHDNYICLECKYRFNGLEEVAKHVKDKEHYKFRSLRYCATLKFDDVLK